jgi:Fe-Mn family superoxide dismutase
MNKKLSLSPLPYSYNGLEPVISGKVLELHHDKHHAAYVNGANLALDKLEKSRSGEAEIDIKGVLRDFSFNYNGAYLHDLFWKNMRAPIENNQPNEDIKKILSDNFGSFEAFQKEFSNAAKTVEGSGWLILSKDSDNNLLIGQLEKHNVLDLIDTTPVLVLDLWEHSYYLDYLNDRASYIEKWWQVVNWDYVGHIMGKIR